MGGFEGGQEYSVPLQLVALEVRKPSEEHNFKSCWEYSGVNS